MRLGVGAMREERAVRNVQRFAQGIGEHEVVDSLLFAEVRHHVRAREQQTYPVEMRRPERRNGSDFDLRVETLRVKKRFAPDQTTEPVAVPALR